MALIDVVRRAFGRKQFEHSGPQMTVNNVFGLPVEYRDILGRSPARMWETQPYLRTVVSFLARNVAQLGLHSFQRVSETDRQRLRDHPVPALFGRPNHHTTSYELIYQLVGDLALYDNAYWMVGEDSGSPSGWRIERIVPDWVVAVKGGDLFVPDWYVLQPPNGKRMEVPAERVLHFHGWAPASAQGGSPPIEALRQILVEQVHAQAYRQQLWDRGGRVGAVLTRPAGAPAWSDDARQRFSADWRAKWAGDDGTQAGGTPILEDGMTLQKVRFSAHEEQFVEASKLALSVVAGVYHVNPTMIGQLDNANYSNVKEFRRMLYGDTLGPLLAQIEDRVNTFLVPRITTDSGVYVEFNIHEKLQGSFEEQASAMSTSVGRPWMTANEARARQNLPALGPEADQLVTPLNVLVGGQASPRDSAPKTVESVGWKARGDETLEAKYVEVLEAFFQRQGAAVQSRLGVKDAEGWWDQERWDQELTDDLYRLAILVASQVGPEAVEQIGFDPSTYNPDVTLAWLRAASERSARSINETTRAQIEQALLEDDDPAAGVRSVFAVARGNRAVSIAAGAVTLISSFATHEAAQQAAPGRAWKRWVTGRNPRPSHAAMDGESVPVSEDFSNGAAWPGDASALGVDDLAGCNCSIRVYIP